MFKEVPNRFLAKFGIMTVVEL